jgi:cell division cycle 2-like protein
MHWDIKTPNILVNDKGEVAVTDYDLIRWIPNPPENLTKHLVTRWYRAPEIIFGSSKYTEKVDIWSFGCVMAELINEEPFFPGENEFD